jgi:hypothetical protein
VIGKTDVKDVDRRRDKITASADDVQRASSIVCNTDDSLIKAIAGQKFTKLNSTWIRRSFKTNVDVSGQNQWLDRR